MRSARKRKDLENKVKKLGNARVVSLLDSSGNLGDDAILLEGTKGQIEFRDANSNQVIYKMVKENHDFRPDVFYCRNLDGKELFRVKIKEHIFSHDEYLLTLHPDTPQAQELKMEKKVLGQERGLIYNGMPVATLSIPKMLSSEYQMHIAPGMDMALFTACAYCHLDKQGEGIEAGVGGVVDIAVSVVTAS